jgi:hypothetical protein
MIPRLLSLLLVALVALAVAPAAASASVDELLLDCQDGRIDKRYADADYRGALADMPVDVDEYSNCRELIRSARQGVRGSGGTGPGSDFNGADGYGALPAGEGGLPLGPDAKPIDPVGIASPEERREVEEARSRTTAPDPVAQRSVPASAGVAPGDRGAELPVPLIVLLVLTGAGALAALVPRLKDLVQRRLP